MTTPGKERTDASGKAEEGKPTAQRALELLRESNDRFRQVAEAINQVFWMAAAEGHQILYISPGYERIWGRTCQSLYNSPRSWLDAIHPEDRQFVVDADLNKHNTGDYDVEYRIMRPDGTERWIHDRAFAIRDTAGRIYRFAGVADDITERKQAERAAAQLAAIIESSEDAIIGKDLRGIVTSWNAGAEKIFGYSAPEMIGQSITRLIPPDREHEEPRILAQIKLGESVRHFETVRLRKNGSPIDVSVAVSAIRDPAGRIIGASKVARDITDRKRLELEVLEISERELCRIGHELHDDICQRLSGTAILAGVLARRLAGDSPEHAARAREVADCTNQTLQSLRMLSRGLAPVIESEGLVDALRGLALNVEAIFHIRCFLCSTGTVAVRDQNTVLHLYRIAQEAISNAVRHGGAREVGIVLRSHEDRVSMVIRDDGCGIPKPPPRTPGMGLRTMRYRAENIGGTLDCRPGAEGGTEIVCVFPNEL